MLVAIENRLEDLQEAKEYDERTSDIKLEELVRIKLGPENVINVLQTKD